MTKTMNYLRKIGNDLLNLFYPNLCRLCRTRLIDGEIQMCISCHCHLPRTNYHRIMENPVTGLLADREKLNNATAFLFYEKGGHVQELIHSVKYYGNKELGYLLGKQAADELSRNNQDNPFQSVDLIIPIPLHRRKQRKRGYNQSEWIARGMAAVLAVPVDTQSTERLVATESQTGKTGYNRWLNVKDIFVVTQPEALQGKHILLVDDVITTGATAGACIDALSEIPDIRISFFSLSVVQQ